MACDLETGRRKGKEEVTLMMGRGWVQMRWSRIVCELPLPKERSRAYSHTWSPSRPTPDSTDLKCWRVICGIRREETKRQMGSRHNGNKWPLSTRANTNPRNKRRAWLPIKMDKEPLSRDRREMGDEGKTKEDKRSDCEKEKAKTNSMGLSSDDTKKEIEDCVRWRSWGV